VDSFAAMPEYDAFGRRTDEDPLAEQGWTPSSRSRPADAVPVEPSPVPVPSGREDAPATAGITAGRPAPPRDPDAPFGAPVLAPREDHGIDASDLARTAGQSFRVIRWILRLAPVAVVVAIAIAAMSAGNDVVRDAVDDFKSAFPTTEAGTGGGAGTGDGDAGGGPVKPAASLLGRAEMAKGLRRLEAEVPGRLRSVRIAADRIDVVVQRGGRMRVAQFAAGAEAPTVFSTSTSAAPTTGTLRYADVRPAAAARLIRAANERLGRKTSQVDYLVPSSFAGSVLWGVYYKGGLIAQGDAKGRFTRRIG